MSWLSQAFWRSCAMVAVSSATAATLMSARSKAPEHVVREWHVDDGLPQEDVQQLLQDRQGYLWVATRGGVARFDGSSFLQTPVEQTQFIGLLEDLDGTVLLLPRTGDPIAVRGGEAHREPLPPPYTGQAIGGGLVAPDGARWITVKGVTLRWTRRGVEAFGSDASISAQSWSWFASDVAGRVWVASDAKLFRYENGRLNKVTLPRAVKELRLASSRTGGPWVVTEDHVLKFDERDRPEVVIDVPPLLGAHFVAATAEDRDGRLWLGTRSQGVHCVVGRTHFHVPTSHDAIYTLVADAEGTVWVGMISGGLNAISPKIYRLYDKTSGLVETVTTAVCEDREGTLWVADGDGGVVRLRNGEIIKRREQVDSRPMTVISVAADPNGGVWATGSRTVFHLDSALERVERIPSVSVEGVRRVAFAAHNGDLWLSLDPDRVGRYREGTFDTFGVAQGFAGREVRTFTEDANGHIWIGTTDSRVYRFDGTTFHPLRLPSERLGAINAILLGPDRIWIATAEGGLVCLRRDEYVRLGTADGLVDDNIAQIVPDEQGNLWCSSGRGVFRLQREDLERFLRRESHTVTPLALGPDEGIRALNSASVYGPSAIKSRDGHIWFATRQGVLEIDPTAPILDLRPPTVAIEEVRCDDRIHALSSPQTIPPGTRKLDLRFSVLCLAAPHRVRVHYRLEGFDTDWVAAEHNHVATYPQLPPGRYQFTVHAGFGGPVEEQAAASITVLIPPLWWQTRLFQIAAVIGSMVFVAVIVRAWSHRRLRRRIEKLERETAVARERARIAENIHDDVGASLTRISLLTQASSPNSTDAANLNRIYETAREITRSLDEIVWAVNPQYDTLESFVSYLTDFAQKFLGVAGVRCRLDICPTLPTVPLSSEMRHDLFLCCREALNNVVKHAGASEVVVRLHYVGHHLKLVIADDGRGVTAARSTPSADRVASGHGTANLRQRMQRIGGSATIDSPPTGGTVVTLAVDVSDPISHLL